MRRELGFVIVVITVAVLSAFPRDGRVTLFPRALSPDDRLIASCLLNELEWEYEYKPSSGRFLVTEEDRAKALSHLVQSGLPREPDYASRPDRGKDAEFRDSVAAVFYSSLIEWVKSDDRATLSVESSWATGPAKVGSVCRMLSLYYPDLELADVDMQLKVGTDLTEEELERFGRASFKESRDRTKAVQAAVDELFPGRAECLVYVGYRLPVVQDDEIDSDFSRYVVSEFVHVDLFVDSPEISEAGMDELVKVVARGARLRPDQGDSIEVHRAVWTPWQRELAAQP